MSKYGVKDAEKVDAGTKLVRQRSETPRKTNTKAEKVKQGPSHSRKSKTEKPFRMWTRGKC